MGLLKHVILPLYALLDLALVFKFLVAEDMSEMLEDSCWSRDIKVVPATALENHFLHCLGAAASVLLLNNVAAIFVENSHYRGMAVFLQMLFFTIDGYSYVRMGEDVPNIIYVIVGGGLVGLMVHANEPGIFTKDKDDGKTKKG